MVLTSFQGISPSHPFLMGPIMPGLKSVTHVSDTSVTYVSGLYIPKEGLSRARKKFRLEKGIVAYLGVTSAAAIY
jgi:hypothetical protein